MSRKRSRLSWTWNDERQEFTTPSGRIVTLTSIAQMLADQRDNQHDFTGPWAGWKMRGDALFPPGHGTGSPRLKPNTTKLFLRWIADAISGDKSQNTRQADHPVQWPACRSIH